MKRPSFFGTFSFCRNDIMTYLSRKNYRKENNYE